MIGRTLGHYQITEKLGEGGMGVVYKARDTHLDRFSAIKVLPPEKVSDPDRKRRFVQEAKAASALNHPGIVTIYDIDQAEGVDYIAMEYVPGKTLDELIPRKGMRLREVLKIAVQVADAVARAHSAAIVHRDLKPSNIMVDGNGLVKVLDFGLAKLIEAGALAEEESTRTLSAGTAEGTILGTVAYMSPEQAEGRPVDARSDVFSFGAVLYEMVTGRRAFQGDSKISTLAAVLHQEPPPLGAGLPRDLVKIVTRCLRKDPAWRFQTMADVRVELAELKAESDSGLLAVPELGRRRLKLVWLTAAVLVLATAGVGLWLGARRHPVSPPMKVMRATTLPGREWAPALSPDGTQIGFVWGGENRDNYDIWVQLIGEETPRRLTTDPARDHSPAWSPDGLRIAFVRDVPDGAEIRLIPAGGGQERLLARSSVSCSPIPEQATVFCGISWSPDGKSLVMVDRDSPRSPNSLFLLDIETRERRRLTSPPAGWAGDGLSDFSPDGRTLAFLRSRVRYPCDLYVLPLTSDGMPGTEPRPLTSASTPIAGLAWTPDSRAIIFAPLRSQGSSQSLWRIPVSGGPSEPLPTLGGDPGFPSISRHGTRLAYATAAVEFHIWRLPLGESPGAAPSRFMDSSASEYFPAPSPDGARIAFVSDRAGSTDIWLADSSGADLRRLTALGDRYAHRPQWSPDANTLAYYARSQDGPFRIFLVGVQGGAPRPLTNREFDEWDPSWSRDGKWVYFDSRSEVEGILQVWKAPVAGGSAVRLTKNGGMRPVETLDGKFLYYLIDGDRRIVRASPDGGEEFTVAQKGFRTLWTLAPGGIYFLDRDAKPKPVIEFLSFADGKRTLILSLPKGADDYGHYFNGAWIAVSPDGRWLYYEQRDKFEGDIMLVENFR